MGLSLAVKNHTGFSSTSMSCVNIYTPPPANLPEQAQTCSSTALLLLNNELCCVRSCYTLVLALNYRSQIEHKKKWSSATMRGAVSQFFCVCECGCSCAIAYWTPVSEGTCTSSFFTRYLIKHHITAVSMFDQQQDVLEFPRPSLFT